MLNCMQSRENGQGWWQLYNCLQDGCGG